MSPNHSIAERVPKSDAGRGAAERQSYGDLWAHIAPFGLIFLLACWVFFTELGRYPLFNPDEGLYAEPAREMLETGEYITTLLNYVVRFTKPPLVIWAMAFSYQVFGVNEFAARFVGAACGAILVAVTYCFIARYAGIRAAVLGSVTLATAPLFVGVGRMAITDGPLSLFLAGGMFSFYRAARERDGMWRSIGYVLVGLAVMTKGPVGVVLPAVALAFYHVLRGDWRQALAFYKPIHGALIVGAVSLPWFVTEIAITRGAYFREFILRENFQRFTSVVDHPGPWWYHIAGVMGGYFPWSVFLPLALVAAVNPPPVPEESGRGRIRGLLAKYRGVPGPNDVLLFSACFALVTVAFFSTSVSKLLPYTLPAFPMLAVMIGIELDRIIASRSQARLIMPLALLAIIYGGAGLVGSTFLHKVRDCPPELFNIVPGYVSFQCVAVSVALLAAVARKHLVSIALFVTVSVGSSAYFGLQAFGAVAQSWEAPIPGFARFASLSGWPLVVFDLRKPGIPFYTGRQVIQPHGDEGLNAKLSELEYAYILTKAKRQALFEKLPGYRITATEGQFMLVEWRRPGG